MSFNVYANVREASPYYELFEGQAPVLSPLPVRLVEAEGQPVCYLIDSSKLTEGQLEQLAAAFYERFQAKGMGDMDAAISYVRDDPPLRIDHFSGISSADPKFIHALADDFDEF